MKRLGPELKMPDMKSLKDFEPPEFLANVYYDLRDRRLLPLVALVVVAIAAVPFLLGGDAEEPAVPPAAEAAEAALEEGVADASTLTVVEASPGLRDYRRRLRGRTATDPFKQRYTGVPEAAQLESSLSGSGSAAGATGGGSSEGSVTEVEETGPPSGAGSSPGPVSSPGSGGSGGSGGSSKPDPDDSRLRFFAFRPDVRFGIAGSEDLTEYEDLATGRLLPKRTPVIVFVGVSEDGKQAAFDVSHEVALVRGEGRCIGGNQSCSLLLLKEGQAADLLTGKPNRDFRLKVEAIDFVRVKRPKAASSSAARQHWVSIWR
jgi:hypothetical protein